MKIFACAFFLLAGFPSSVQWVQVASNTTINLKAVDFPTSQVGYAVGWVGGNSVIIKSIDSGLTWDVIDTTHSGSKFEIVSFLNADTGFVASQNDDFYRTMDGGQTWNDIQDVELDYIRDLTFINDVGFLAGIHDFYTSRLYKTFDQGFTWSMVYEQDSMYFGSISFVDSLIGYATPGNGAGNAFNKIYKTDNGGNEWQTISFNSLNATQIQDIFFYNEEIGFVGGFYLNHSMKTLNGGINWEPIDIEDGEMPETFFISEYDSIIYIGSAKIFRSTDLGVSWAEQDIPSDIILESIEVLRDLAFINDSIAVAVGGNGLILRTSNGGVSLNVDEKNLKKKISIYPNPSSNQVNIHVDKGVVVRKVELMDINGKVAKSFSANLSQLDLSGLSAGTYILRIGTDQGEVSKRVVVE